MSRVLRFFEIVIFVFVFTIVYVNVNPSVVGVKIEVLMIFSGLSPLLINSLYTSIVLSSFFGIIMSAFGEGLLIYNIALCVCYTFLNHPFKDKGYAYKVMASMLMFSLRQFVWWDYGIIFPALNTLIFCSLNYILDYIEKRRVKCIF